MIPDYGDDVVHWANPLRVTYADCAGGPGLRTNALRDLESAHSVRRRPSLQATQLQMLRSKSRQVDR